MNKHKQWRTQSLNRLYKTKLNAYDIQQEQNNLVKRQEKKDLTQMMYEHSRFDFYSWAKPYSTQWTLRLNQKDMEIQNREKKNFFGQTKRKGKAQLWGLTLIYRLTDSSKQGNILGLNMVTKSFLKWLIVCS